MSVKRKTPQSDTFPGILIMSLLASALWLWIMVYEEWALMTDFIDLVGTLFAAEMIARSHPMEILFCIPILIACAMMVFLPAFMLPFGIYETLQAYRQHAWKSEQSMRSNVQETVEKMQ